MRLDAEIALAHRLADAARAAIRPHFRAGLTATRKADASPVTVADRAAEQAMRALIAAALPGDAIHGEEYGVTTVKLVCLLAAPEGVQTMFEQHPDVVITTASLDEKLNDHGYIVPGLGDAGDRIFGTR